MLGFTWDGLELQIRKTQKWQKWRFWSSIFACYRSCFMIWKASICHLEWFCAKTLVLLVQVLEVRSSYGNLHILEILRHDFELEVFSDDDDDPKSFRVSFVSVLIIHFVHFVKISWNGLKCSLLQILMDFRCDLVLCLC